MLEPYNQAPNLERSLNRNETGDALLAVNNEARAAFMGVASLQPYIPTEVIAMHKKLKGLGYNKFADTGPTTIRRMLDSSPDSTVSLDKTDDSVKLKALGLHAASIGGLLLRDLPNEANIGHYRLIGGKRAVGESELNSAAIRLSIYDILLRPGGPKPQQAITEELEEAGIKRKATIRQLDRIQDVGLIESDGSRQARKSIPIERIELITAFNEIVTTFVSDQSLRKDGLDFMKDFVEGRLPISDRMASLMKRAAVQSGKSNAPEMDKFVEDIEAAIHMGEEVTTTELAVRIGRDTTIVSKTLDKMEVKYASTENVPLRRTCMPRPGNIRVKERTWGRPKA